MCECTWGHVWVVVVYRLKTSIMFSLLPRSSPSLPVSTVVTQVLPHHVNLFPWQLSIDGSRLNACCGKVLESHPFSIAEVILTQVRKEPEFGGREVRPCRHVWLCHGSQAKSFLAPHHVPPSPLSVPLITFHSC